MPCAVVSFAPEAVLEETYRYVRTLIATVSPESLRQTRRQIYRDLHRNVAQSVEESESLLRTMMKQPDYAEGVDAFLKKRAPNWRGREDA